MGIGARHDDEPIVGAPVGGRLDPVAHLGCRHEGLAGPVAAALGRDLVLDVQTGSARTGHFPDCPGDVESRAPAGVGIDQERQVGGPADPPDVLADIVQAGHAQIRQAERCVRHTGAGQVDGPESRGFGEQGAVGVDGADDLKGALGFDRGPQACAG